MHWLCWKEGTVNEVTLNELLRSNESEKIEQPSREAGPPPPYAVSFRPKFRHFKLMLSWP